MNPEKLAAELQELLPTKSAAKFLGVTDRTIQNYRQAGILTPQAFGKDFSALYTKGQLIAGVKSYQNPVKRYTGKENVQL